jgi:hypothetical protein
MKYKKHIFICTNQKANPEAKCCGETHGMELVNAFKKLISDAGLNVDNGGIPGWGFLWKGRPVRRPGDFQ